MASVRKWLQNPIAWLFLLAVIALALMVVPRKRKQPFTRSSARGHGTTVADMRAETKDLPNALLSAHKVDAGNGSQPTTPAPLVVIHRRGVLESLARVVDEDWAVEERPESDAGWLH